jgi:hypothetical protein
MLAAHWIAPEGTPLPGLIIGGAMKCGTTTLHHILARHPKLFIPKGELHFFDMDDLLQHGDFNRQVGGQWQVQAMERGPERMWAWYGERFQGAAPGQLLGEDSTTYLASPLAIRRIALQRQPIRLVFILREPVARSWSHYWHLLRSGRATRTFEETLRREPHSVLDRSLYLDQLRTVFEHIPRQRVKVLLFDDLLKHRKDVVNGLLAWVGLDPAELPADALQVHSNAGGRPRFPGLQRWRNRWAGEAHRQRYMQRLPWPQEGRGRIGPLDRIHGAINPIVPSPPPPMKAATRIFLEGYFRKRLDGLDELLGQPVLERWYGRA